MSLTGEKFCCSWSGGKDSCLALYRAKKAGGRPRHLLTMLTEEGERTRSHGLPRAVIAAQAESIGVELHVAATSWDNYEQSLIGLLRGAKQNGIEHAVFGDIDIQRHRDWEEKVCAEAGVRPHLPLWQQDRMALLREWWQLGFEARIVAAKEGVVSPEYLGAVLDERVAKELTEFGVDACGENGEFHTLVTDGPLFARPLHIKLGSCVQRSGYWFQDLGLMY